MRAFLKPLSLSEEKEYLLQYQRGSPEAKNILIERNLRLVAHIVKKYQNTDEELDDLISIGTIGLIKAISTFDGEKASRLCTYAARCIENAILSQMRLWFQTMKLTQKEAAEMIRLSKEHYIGFEVGYAGYDPKEIAGALT